MDAPFAPPARLALHIYAGLTGGIGSALILRGPHWLFLGADDPHGPFAQAAIIRIAGAVLVTLAMSGMAIATSGDAAVLSRAINWFTGAHLVLWLVVTFQVSAILKPILQPGLAAMLSWLLVLLLFGLAYVREAAAESARRLGGSVGAALAARSRYDQAIRDAASQEERHRLARDLHDSVKQQIFAIQTAAATAETRLDSDRTGVGEAMTLVRSSAREAMTEMEAMLDQLRAAPLDNAGLVAALRKLCDAVGFRTGATVTFTAGELPADSLVDAGVRPAILRIAQEALANVARHARARAVTVRLEAAGGAVALSVVDDGSGFDAGAGHGGMGLRNMRSRADDVGGTLAVVARPGAGTIVRASIPIAVPVSVNLNEKWKPWKSDILPWALASLVGTLWRPALPTALVVVALWTLSRAWYDHRARRRATAAPRAAA